MPQVALTDRFINGVKSVGAQTDFFDEKVHGLAVRVSSAGRKTWSFVFSAPGSGKRARMTLGGYPQTSLAQARALALEARGHLDDGLDPRDLRATRETGAMTLSGLVKSYLEKHVRPNLKSAVEIERRLERNVLPLIGNVALKDFHRRDVNRVVDPVLKRGRRVEAGRVFEDLRAMLRWGVARGDLDHNPIDGMKKPNGNRPRERTLSDAEITKLWKVLPTGLARSKACQRIIKLCLLTAQRVGECAGMEVTELDLNAAKWTIPGARTKNGYKHVVPFSPPALEVISEAMTDAPGRYLFPAKDGGPLPGAAVARTIHRAQERFGLDAWTAHDLRRTAVSGMAQEGVPPIVLGHIINHRSVTKAGVTLSVYSQYTYDAERRQALEAWAERVMTLAGSPTLRAL